MKKAVVLFNLGGPDNLESVEPFLFNLFNDPAIINLPTLIRYPLAKIISKKRTPIAKKIYEEIGGSSPILKLTTDQAIELEKSLNAMIDLSAFPNAVVDIYVDLPQTDAGTRCAAISAASIALADAGIPMKDMISSVAVGEVDGTVVADLCYDEEAYDAIVSDIPVAMTHNTKEITLLQMDGEISKEHLMKALEMASIATDKVYELQMKALKDKFVPRSEK